MRGWAAVLLLAAVFLGHGLQCGPGSGGAAHAGHGVDTAVAAAVTAADTHLTPSAVGHGGGAAAPIAHDDAARAATAGSAPGHWHGLPGHLWAVCLAVLATGLAVLLSLAARRLLRQAPPAALPAWLRGLPRPAPARPPDLFSLCVLRT
ncbi:hypothetical protein SAMN05660642_01598 [Geodermatophilus siccatus]|uniref:MYXO-CTERM domain-containing protein n=1 Tax=Geodermatophilus siccatus TaxID=1137991 RepID=A0A1G9QDS2_9ACTN|nr:hypothetical protein SAMN05660642_01598 [Geodermatophilus siccatus]